MSGSGRSHEYIGGPPESLVLSGASPGSSVRLVEGTFQLPPKGWAGRSHVNGTEWVCSFWVAMGEGSEGSEGVGGKHSRPTVWKWE